jgi:glycosyltransferase involved in cell wall biosynthesis
MDSRGKILLVANTDWYLYNFRLSLAKRLREEGWETVLISPDGPYRQALLESGFKWIQLPLSRRGVLPTVEVRTFIQLRRIYRQEKPDLIHHHTIKPNIYGSLAATASGDPAIVNSITGLGYLFLSSDIFARLLRPFAVFLYRKAFQHPRVRVIFENRGDREVFLRHAIVQPGQHTLIRGVGVDLERFDFAPMLAGDPLVILPARMLWDKGVGDFISAARTLKSRNLQVQFALVGDIDPGNPSSIPRSQLEAWVEEGMVAWWGHRMDMPEIYAASHVVVLPSKAEGTPTVLLEAAAAGRPVVASDIAGCREVVIPGKTGLLVPPEEPEALANALESLLENQAWAREMGRKARRHIEKHFDQDSVNEKTIAVYRRALAGELLTPDGV